MRPPASLSSVESAGQLCGQSRSIKYAAAFLNFGRCEGRGRPDLASGMEGGHLGTFVRDMKEHLCWGHAALWGLSVLAVYFRGKYECLINKSGAQGRCSEKAAASQNQAARVHTRTICPPVKHGPKMSLTLRIPENLISATQSPHKEGVCEGHSAVPQTDRRSGTRVRGRLHVKAPQRPIKILFWCHPQVEIACGSRPSQVSAAWLWMF